MEHTTIATGVLRAAEPIGAGEDAVPILPYMPELIFGLIVFGLFAWRLNVNHHYHPLVLINAWKRRRLLRKTGPAATVEAR